MTEPDRSARLIVYGHAYCWQAALLADALREHQIDHDWRDVVEGDSVYRDELKKLARGYLSVPTVIFPDGTVMVEPLPDQVLDKIGLTRAERLKRKITK